MKSITFALSAFASFASITAAGWYNNTVITSDVTVTGYTTYCPESTIVTITTCSDHKCAPSVITATDATTITITGECVIPTTVTKKAGTSSTEKASVITGGVTVTGYTTYCPEPTVVTITTCISHKCSPALFTASVPTTIIITGECVIPSTYTKAQATYTTEATGISTYVTVTGYTSYYPEPTVVTLTTCHKEKCAPRTITCSEPTTLVITEPCLIPTIVTSEQIVTTQVTVAGLTTYCPSPTVVTITTCSDDKCAPVVYTASAATTLVITEPCLVPSTYITVPTLVTSESKSTVAAESSSPAVTSFEAAAAAKAAAGAAGLIGVLALLV